MDLHTMKYGITKKDYQIFLIQKVMSILFWNNFPGPTTPPDVTLQSSQIGTPRSIISNGDYVMIGDENAAGPCSGVNGNRSTHVFTSWPTSSKDPDACVEPVSYTHLTLPTTPYV